MDYTNCTDESISTTQDIPYHRNLRSMEYQKDIAIVRASPQSFVTSKLLT